MVTAKFGSKDIQFMVDTGATASTINELKEGMTLSGQTLAVVGFSGVVENQPYTSPVHLKFGNQEITEKLLFAPKCPVNLLARDLMSKLGIRILCSPEGLQITWPGGQTQALGQYVQTIEPNIETERENSVDVYWGRLLEADPCPGLIKQYLEWKPLIDTLGEYLPPKDSPHVTWLYDSVGDTEYQYYWEKHWEGKEGVLYSTHIIVGPEGVAAELCLDREQMSLYDEALNLGKCPHVTLAVAPGHKAKQLGHMMYEALAAEYEDTGMELVKVSKCGKYTKMEVDAYDMVKYEKVTLNRTVPGENTDSVLAAPMLEKVPNKLWTRDPYDVGKIEGEVTLVLKHEVHRVWRSQYTLKPEQVLGIEDTIMGLLRAGVLRETTSRGWNTPILPVPKAGGKGWRMVHDLRAINEVTETINLPVPDPYVALRGLTPDHQCFSVIDLANAFFCLPLTQECQEWFAFTFQGKRYTYNRLPQGYKDSPGLFNQALKAILQGLKLPTGTVLIQYVDDLLIAAKGESEAVTATKLVLHKMAEAGFKVKREKCQVARKSVTFLGRTIGGGGTSLTDEQRQTILGYGKPETVKDMLAFLGLCGYSRTYVPNFTGIT